MLILDAGDFAADAGPGNDFFTEGVVEGMRRLGYAAAALGGRDLAAGAPLRATLRERAGFPVLAANLPPRQRRQWGAAPYTIREFPNFSVGIIGMAGTLKTGRAARGFAPRLPEGTPRLRDYRKSLWRNLKKLRKRCDVIILLAQADHGQAMGLLEEFPEIDLLISARDSALARDPHTVGISVLGFTGTEGKQLGYARLRVYPNRTVGLTWGTSLKLGKKVKEDPESRALVQRTTARANAWHRTRAEAALTASHDPVNAPSPFQTAATCQPCHARAYAVWKASAHARAMEVLEAGHQDFLPQCVSCHVTGMDQPGGFRDRLRTPDLIQVQCEACHGPAEAHLADPTRPYGPVGLSMCADTCHTPEQTGGGFDVEPKWELIRH